MSEVKKVVLVGWNPAVVDYAKWPGLSVEKLTAALEADKQKLSDLGYDTQLLFVDNAYTAADTVKSALLKAPADCVLIGAGVRTDSDYLVVFERLINAIHEAAPDAKICFNTGPADTAEAVQRWV